MAINKERLDVALVRRGLAPSRERARALIMAGQVLVAGHLVDKPGTLISLDAECSLKETPDELKYVSRGGLKLEKALATFGLHPEGLVALDVGASTGGFTDCLLRHGAKRVYALDVGQGQLAWTLRNDPRVVVMEHTNIRYLNSLPESNSMHRYRCLFHLLTTCSASACATSSARRMGSSACEAPVRGWKSRS